jgi:hypothetical protein
MIIGLDGDIVRSGTYNIVGSGTTGGLNEKKPIVDMRIVIFGKMMVHPQTKEMVMVPMQDVQYKRQGSEEWFSMEMVEVEKHDFNPENKNEKNLSTNSFGVS